jgi:hypothetical protein
MSLSFIVVWVGLVVIAYTLRLYCVSAIQTKSPLYELPGKPAFITPTFLDIFTQSADTPPIPRSHRTDTKCPSSGERP